MLVLTRREGESLFVGDVRVFIDRLSGGRVRIGIDAPPSVPVHRSEVRDRILAAGGDTSSMCPCCGCQKKGEAREKRTE